MHETQFKILEILKNSDKPLSTKDLLLHIYSDYKTLVSKLSDEQDRLKINNYKREIAKLHRKLLHHLNQLVVAGFIREAAYGKKGLKYYQLNINDGEILEINKKIKGSVIKKTLALEKPLTIPLEGYEEKGIIFRYSSKDFIGKLNSICLFANNFTLEELTKNLHNFLTIVNDSICIENFEHLINYYNKTNLLDFLAKARELAREYGRVINLAINLNKLEKKSVGDFIKNSSENLVFILNVNNSSLFDYSQILENIIDELILTRGTLFIKNNEIKKSPYFIGKAGVYAFDAHDLKKINKETNVLACAQATVIIDIKNYISQYSFNPKNFYDFIMKVVKFLSLTSFSQRKNFEFIFRNIEGIDSDFMFAARNYVRFWNYNLAKTEERDFIFDLINNSKQIAKEFAHNQETIYKSCGLPINFKIAFSCAFRQAHQRLSEMEYERLELNDLENKETKQELKIREKLCNVLDCNRVGVYKKRAQASNVIKDIYEIFRNYKIEFLGYNFKEARKDMKLDWFIK